MTIMNTVGRYWEGAIGGCDKHLFKIAISLAVSVAAFFFTVFYAWNTYIIYIKIASVVVITEIIYLNCVNHLMTYKEKTGLKIKSIGLSLYFNGLLNAVGWIIIGIIELFENYYKQTIIGLVVIVSVVIWFIVNMILPIRKN